jgi:hypothetical protein
MLLGTSINMQEIINSLNEQGYAKIENSIPQGLIISLWEEMHEVGKIIAERLSLELGHFENPDQSAKEFLLLSSKKRRFISILYDQCKQLPSFLRLATWKGLSEIYGTINGTRLVGIGENSYGVRFDLPNEDQFRSHWHQEFAYNPQSPEGLVFWIPLVDVYQGMGSVEIMRSSNKGGLIEHNELEKYSFKRGLYRVGIPNEEALLKIYPVDQPLSNAGDILLMRFDTIHQSGRNVSDRLRVTLQVRYFGFDHPEAAAHFWPSRPSEFFGYDVQGKK